MITTNAIAPASAKQPPKFPCSVKNLVCITKEGLELPEDDSEKTKFDEIKKDYEEVCSKIKELLDHYLVIDSDTFFLKSVSQKYLKGK